MSRKHRRPNHTPAPAPTAPSRPFNPARQVGHARGRVSLDSPDRLIFGTFNSLSPPDYESEWRTGLFDDRTLDRIDTPALLLRLVDLSPEAALGLWNYLRFSNAGWEVKAYRANSAEQTEDPRAQAVIDQFLAQLKHLYGSVDVPINRLFLCLFLRGAMVGEIVLDRAGRVPVDLATPDPRWVLFESRNDPVRGVVFVPYQQQGGQRVYLDRETIRYVPLDPAPGSPFGRAIASPVIFSCLFDMALLHDLKRVVQQQGYPRLDVTLVGENMEHWASSDVLLDPDKRDRHVEQLIKQVETRYSQLQPEDVFVHTDDMALGRPVGTIDSHSLGAVDGLTRYLERKLVRACKSSPFLFGLSESTTETQANRQMEAWLGSIEAGQHLCESLLEHLLTLALQAQGIQAIVEWRFAVVRASELLRDTQVEEAKMRVAALGWALGYWSQDEAADYATGKQKADVEEPRALPNTLTPVGAQTPAPADVTQGEGRAPSDAQLRELLPPSLRDKFPVLPSWLRDHLVVLWMEKEFVRDPIDPETGTLPPLPDDVEVTPADIRRGLSLWDELQPDFATLLDAEVV